MPAKAATIVLFHVDDLPVEEVVDGRLFVIPPNEAVEFDLETGIVVMQHKHYQGIVEVGQLHTARGVEWDLETAGKEAATKLYDEEIKTINEYVRSQIEDRVRKNYPALPPSGRVERLINKHGIDIKRDFGFEPVGMRAVGNRRSVASGQDVVELRQINVEQQDRISRLEKLVEQLLDNQNNANPTPKMPPPPPIEEQAQQSDVGAAIEAAKSRIRNIKGSGVITKAEPAKVEPAAENDDSQ